MALSSVFTKKYCKIVRQDTSGGKSAGMNVNIREELIHLLSVSATMAGLCIMGVTMFFTMASKTFAGTVADDILAVCALLFLLCTYFVFWALRTKRQGIAVQLVKFADAFFAMALTGMVVAGFIMVYTIL